MVRAKICGLTTDEAVAAALAGGADFLGFMHFAASPRHVDLREAARLAAPARGRAAVVVVTVEPSDALVDEIQEVVAPDFIQLHGRETPARAGEIAERLPVIKVLPVAEAADLAPAAEVADVAQLLMFDAKPPPAADRPGGLGTAYDWSLLAGRRFAQPYFLAGGLDPTNVRQAVRVSGAPMVDVSSGVEARPGLKDPALIEAFLAALRQAL
jgi:phosphoribosylanthranilate isomerase